MRLKVDARARRLLRRLPVVNVYSLAEIVLIGGLAVQCARLAWVVVTPVGALGDWRPAQPLVAGSPLDVLTGFDPFFRSAAANPQAATVTSLQLTLFGTRMDDATGRGSAIVAGPDGVQRSVSVGEEVQPGVVLKAVAFDHVTLSRGGGADEDLFLDQSGAPPAPPLPGTSSPTGGPPPAEGGAGVSAARLRSEIGFIPRIDGGRLTGLTVRPQGSGALFRGAGLREGDVVTGIGGRPVTGPGDLDRVAADFAKGGNIPITVERGDQTLPLAITVVATQ